MKSNNAIIIIFQIFFYDYINNISYTIKKIIHRMHHLVLKWVGDL